VPASGQKPHASAITSRQHAENIQLDLMNPAIGSRRVRGWAGEARFDEASQTGTHMQHGGSIKKLCASVNYLTSGRQKI
jgi:hypothetical protein